MDDEAEARAYAAADFRNVNGRFVHRLLELAGNRRSCRLLDLGCGPGDIPVAIAKERPNWQIYAVDAAEAMLTIARKRGMGLPNLHVQFADAKHLPLSLGKFDVITSNSLLHHVACATTVWRAVLDVANKNALVFFRDLYRPATEQAADQIVRTHAGQESALLQKEFRRSLLSAYTPEEIHAQLKLVGIRRHEIRTINDRHVDIIFRIER